MKERMDKSVGKKKDVLIVNTQQTRSVKIEVETMDDLPPEAHAPVCPSDGPFDDSLHTSITAPWIMWKKYAMNDAADADAHEFPYCQLCSRWCDQMHLQSAGHQKRVHNQADVWFKAQEHEAEDLASVTT